MMPKKIIRRVENTITPEAVAAFKARDWQRLQLALKIPPWEPSPLDMKDGEPYPEGLPAFAESWSKIQALRKRLQAAVREADSK